MSDSFTRTQTLFMFILSFFRTIKYALKDFMRNFWLSLVTVTILVLTLLTINILIVFSFLTQTSIALVEKKLDVMVFFFSEVEDAEVLTVKSELEALPQVAEVRFISREERVQNFQKEYEDNEVIVESLEEIDENPFGSALVIRANEASEYDIIISVLQQDRYAMLIEGKDYKNHQEVIQKIVSITNQAQRSGEIMSLVFGVIAILIVFNTIRIAIYTHKDEIHIMRTVGAANWFVKSPYLLQGMLYSILAVVVTIVLWFFVLRFVDPYVMVFLGSSVSVMEYFKRYFVPIFGFELLITMLVNLLSSSFALRRYLR